MGCNFSKQSNQTIRGKPNQISPISSVRDLLDGEQLDRVDYAIIQNIGITSQFRPNLRINIPTSYHSHLDKTHIGSTVFYSST